AGGAWGQALDRTAIGLFAQSAARVFRGTCTGADPAVVALPGGGTVAATTYSFTVVESLKGAQTTTVRFTQVGRPGGDVRDLGRRVGLPTYELGAEYVLFLLPESRRGLTSPAGAGEGALSVHGQQLTWLRSGSFLGVRTRLAAQSGKALAAG